MAGNTTGTGEVAPVTNDPTGIFGAANAFEQFLTAQEAGNQEEVEASGNAAADGADEEPQASDEAEADETVEDEADEQSDETEVEQEEPKDQLFTVRVDGKDESVPLSELLAGYSRTKDYTQKTQALAHERKQFAQTAEQVRAQQAEYGALLPKLRAALEADLKEPNWEELRNADPARAAVEYDRFQERKQRVAAIKAEEDRVAKEQEQEFAAQRNQILIEEQQKLLARPELQHWRDPAKADADAKEIVDALKAAGFGDEELQIFDHRAMVIAWQAAQYRKSQVTRAAAQKSVQQKATKAPVAKPGNGGGQAPSALNKARSRLAKSGSVYDAAKVFENFL
jgi:hypothetical protein